MIQLAVCTVVSERGHLEKGQVTEAKKFRKLCFILCSQLGSTCSVYGSYFGGVWIGLFKHKKKLLHLNTAIVHK